GGDELAREVAIAHERSAGKTKRERLHQVRKARIGLLRDQSAHAVTHEHNRLAAERFDEARERERYLLQVVRLDMRAMSVGWLVPSVRRVAEGRKVGELPLPGVVAASQAVQKNEVRAERWHASL